MGHFYWKKNKDKTFNLLRRKGFQICPYYAIRAHVRNGRPAKWCGHQDGFRDAGTLQCGFHPGHIRPRDHSGTEGGGQYDGQRPLRQSPALNAPDSRMGQNMGQETTAKIKRPKK